MDKESTAVQIYGLIGYPVIHSFSPAMHNAAFKELNIPAEYRLFEVKPEELEEFLLKKIFSENITGLNITIPHKVRVREILEKRFPSDDLDVRLSGAVNTVKRDGDNLLYYNTDVSGFRKSLKINLKFDSKGKNIFIIGCGGAGRSIIAALSWMLGIKTIYINDISNEAMSLAEKHFKQVPALDRHTKLKFILTEEIPNIITDCHLLVNASPVGMKESDSSVIDKNLFHRDLSVYDVVYNRETQLIRDAKSRGLRAVNGLGMLLYQGVDAFELWTGQKAPVEIMRKALIGALSK